MLHSLLSTTIKIFFVECSKLEIRPKNQMQKEEMQETPIKNKIQKQKQIEQKPNVLIICTFSVFGGIEMHTLSMYKTLLKNGYKTFVVIPQGSALEKRFNEEQLPFYGYKPSKILKPHRQVNLRKLICKIIEKHQINIVHCNRAKDTYLLKKSTNAPFKTIFTRHAASQIRTKYLKQFDGIIGVNQDYIKKTKELFYQKKFSAPIMHLAPFFNDEEFLNFAQKQNKEDFFRKEFNIKLPDYPILVQIASLSNVKNHKILLKAAHKLIYEKNKHVIILICGDGYNKNYLKKLATKLGIEKFIFLLGFTEKRIGVMYHSDIKILTSKYEAFGIVLMEAALLKKPLIGSTNTGVVNIIKHEKTGLLFENGNVDDLVKQIEKLIDNPELQKKYGQNAYEHVKNNLVSDVSMKKLGVFYKKILGS